MDFLRFYGRVFREAFRHSLDIAQATIFILAISAGLVVSKFPAVKVTIESWDLNGWQVAVFILGGIFAIRLILAPYWVWQATRARIVPSQTIDFGFRFDGMDLNINKRNGRARVGFKLANSIDAPIQYRVEDISLNLNGADLNNPKFNNLGTVVSRLGKTTFYCPVIPLKLKGSQVAQGAAGITYSYGLAGQKYVRRAKYVVQLTISLRDHFHTVLEDEEVTI